ncbi:hypothetical protein J3R82DRAFT_1383 [Butyriboletus roseoflavus]|nr:hypothetical protein J3R82DRAFT_1383 [Butyriboletus roseoflavus]
MVQTRSSAKTIETGQAHSNNGVLLANDTTVEHPGTSSSAKKRRRQVVTPPKKRRRGKPGELCQLNLDVLFLIAAYIHPLDLLNLARTCKSLRVLLMDKSSAFVWRTARRQVNGLPECPDDLTEPEYANLVFYARCHVRKNSTHGLKPSDMGVQGCGKHAKIVFWEMRRRYCPDCRAGRLCRLMSCHSVIRNRNVLAEAHLTIEKESGKWVDREQMDVFLNEYKRSYDKEQLISDRQEQLVAIREHARGCKEWERDMAAVRQDDLAMRRQERATSIFERLKQHGYNPEVVHHGRYEIQASRRSLFRTSKPLTDKEWDRIWPEWLGTMNRFRSMRLESVVYGPRRRSLVSEYHTYVTSPSPNAPTLDLLPHVIDIARFPPFRDIIRAPEGAQMNSKLFESAFAQLPALVDEWRKKLDAELAEQVKIPSHLSIQDASGVASNSVTTRMEASQAATDKLRLACALFYSRDCPGIFTPAEVFLVAMHHRVYPTYSVVGDSERTGSIRERFAIGFMEAAPYIVHACGLDPDVATAEDMDRLNARLKCLCCQKSRFGSWRDAVRLSLC